MQGVRQTVSRILHFKDDRANWFYKHRDSAWNGILFHFFPPPKEVPQMFLFSTQRAALNVRIANLRYLWNCRQTTTNKELQNEVKRLVWTSARRALIAAREKKTNMHPHREKAYELQRSTIKVARLNPSPSLFLPHTQFTLLFHFCFDLQPYKGATNQIIRSCEIDPYNKSELALSKVLYRPKWAHWGDTFTIKITSPISTPKTVPI